jgi:LAO/AO transport system kinase
MLLPAILSGLEKGDRKMLARAISIVENESTGYEELLLKLPVNTSARIIGITGPPGAGKSTLADALIGEMVKEQTRVGVLCIDPSSPFHKGSLLGDRIRMNHWHAHPQVFIRSLATRGSLGGLNHRILEITEVMKSADFDYILVETVGIGQSEVEIAGLADTTVVVVVPEAGDDIQVMKAGVMEIADIFVVNKSDRPGADIFVKNLRSLFPSSPGQNQWQVPVLKTAASQQTGIPELFSAIKAHAGHFQHTDRRHWLRAEKAYQVIQNKFMSAIDKKHLLQAVQRENHFNLHRFVRQYLNQ